MQYKYITENNLENIQKYNYSEFHGSDFVYSYFETRKSLLETINQDEKNNSSLDYAQIIYYTQTLYQYKKINGSLIDILLSELIEINNNTYKFQRIGPMSRFSTH